MKKLFLVKWNVIINKGKHKNGLIEFNNDSDEVKQCADCVFAEDFTEAIELATKGWKNIKVTQVREYQETKRIDY